MRRNLFLLAALGIALGLFWLDRLGDSGGRAPLVLVDRPALEEGARGAEGRAPAPVAPRATVQRGEAGPGRASARTSEPRPTVARVLRGTVVGTEGRLAGARVRGFAEGEEVARTLTGELGAFELAVPVPQQGLVLHVDAPGYTFLVRDLGPVREAGAQVIGNLFLRPGSPLAGVVEDAEGSPIAGAEVQVTTLRGRSIQEGLGERTRTDARGRFRFDRAPDGSVVLTGRAPGFGETSVEFVHRPNADARLVLPPGRELHVRVLDQDGRGVAGVRLSIRSQEPGSGARDALTDEEGYAHFESLAAKSWTVRAEKRGFKPSAVFGAEAGPSEVALRLVAWPGAVGRVETSEGGPPPAGTEVFALPLSTRGDLAGRLSGGTPVGEDGGFRVLDLRPGDYRLIVDAPGYARASSRPFRVGDTGDSQVGTVRVDHGGDLELTLRCAGAPAAGIRAELLDRTPLPGQLYAPPLTPGTPDAVSGGDGVLALRNLAPGAHWLILRGDRTVPRALGPYAVSTGSTARPTPIELEPGAPIRGLVVGAAGAPLAGARVHVEGPRATVPFLATEVDGRFETPPLPAGAYRVQVTAIVAGHPVAAPDETVTSDGRTPAECRVQLPPGDS